MAATKGFVGRSFTLVSGSTLRDVNVIRSISGRQTVGLTTRNEVAFGAPSSRCFGALANAESQSEGSYSGRNSEKRSWAGIVTAAIGSVVVGNVLVNGDSTVKADDGKDAKSKFSSFSFKDIKNKVKSKVPDPSATMKLYWASGSPPCWRVMIALEEKGLTNYESKLLQMSDKEHKSAEVLAINPRGQMPTFTHDGVAINESLAIVDYLESYFPYLGTSLQPMEPADRAQVLQRKYESLNLFTKGLMDYTFYTFRKPEEKTKAELETRLKAFRDELDLWEKILKKTGRDGYVAGNAFSTADLALFPFIALMWRLGLNLDKWPSIKAYFEKVRQRESVQKTWPPHWTGDNKTVLADV